MAAAKSTLTAAHISANDGARWANLQAPIQGRALAGQDLAAVDARDLKVMASGGQVYLEGLTYRGSGGHISLTPNGMGDWTYFHFTAVGGAGANAYYALEDDQGDLAVVGSTFTVIDGRKIDVSRAQYFWKGVPADLTADVSTIVKALVAQSWVGGEAV